MNLLKETTEALKENGVTNEGSTNDVEEINKDEIGEFDDYVSWVVRNGAAIE